MSVIEIDDLVVDYGSKRALDGLTLRVKKGQIFGFIGPNGAGKTTTIKALLGMIPISRGSVRLRGVCPSHPKSRHRIGFLPEEAVYYRFLTPLEILTFYGKFFHIPRGVLRQRIQRLLDLVGLADVARKHIGTFSKGMLQKVGLAQSLVNEPEILILDEPTSGLDPVARMDLRALLEDLRAKAGTTVFFSSHELSEVELLCDSIAILKSGRVVKGGELNDVLGVSRQINLERFFLDTMEGESA